MAEAELVDRLRAALAPLNVREQRMFGGTCFMLDGNMLVGTSRRGLLVRVGKEAHAVALHEKNARPMQMRDRTMQGYVFIDPAGLGSKAALQGWIDRALAYVRTLPPKTGEAGRPATKRRAAKRE